MTFITTTTVPLLIALAAIGLGTGVMIPANAAPPGRIVGLGAALFVPLVWVRISAGGPMISIGHWGPLRLSQCRRHPSDRGVPGRW
jgi:hypothetical protein